jgi:Trypsin-like peptidase domain
MADRDEPSPDDPGPVGATAPGDSVEAPSAKGHKRPLWLAALAALVTFLALYGAYSRQSSDGPGGDSPASPAGLFQQSQAAGTSLTAVGRTTGLAEHCTAWLVDTGAAADAGAYAVTSARCVGQADPASVMTGRELEDAHVEFNAFAPLTTAKQPDLVKATVEAVEWASVRGTDLAVLRLGATYGELAGRGVRPIDPVAAAEQGAEILIAGVPVEGIEPNQQYLRGSRCQVGETTDVLEDGLLDYDVQASGCAGILGGSAGSPVFNPAGEAVAMVTTTTIGATEQTACALGLPCQVADDGGISVKGDTNYMVPVAALAACFPAGVFTLGGQCALEDPAGVVPARAVAPVAKPGATVVVQLEGDLPEGFASATSIKVKQGPLGTVDCSAADGWLGAAQAAAKAALDAGVGADQAAPAEVQGSASASPEASPGVGGDSERPGATPAAGSPAGAASDTATAPGLWLYPAILPQDEGFTMVCVGSASQHTEVVIRADGTAPDPGTIELTTTAVEAGVMVEPVFDPPELSQFRWVSGPYDSIDCATAEGYVEYRRVPATIQAADLPSTVCVIGIDEAGNESKPAAIKVE